MARGPKPTPTAILRARGSWRGEARKNEPVLACTIPDPPQWLKAAARKYWAPLVSQLEAMRVVTTADAVALGMLCDALAKYDLAKGIVEAEGIIAVGRDGTIREHPASRTQDSAAERIVRLCREFGLTPSARAVVKVPDQKPPEDNDISRFLRLA